MALLKRIAHHPWSRRALLGASGFLVLFGLFGHFVLPGIIKSQAEARVGELLQRQLTIGAVRINPFALTLDVDDVRLMEPDGKRVFVCFAHLHANLSAQSLFRFGPVLKAVRLDRPHVHLARTAPNRYNIDDLLAMGAGELVAPASGPARFAVYNLEVKDGRVEFEDRPVGTTQVISELAIGVPFISSLPSKVDVFVQPYLGARVNGVPLRLEGKARPFAAAQEADIALTFLDIDLTRYLGYLPFEPRFKLPAARLDIALNAAFLQPPQQAASLRISGRVALRELALTELDGSPLLGVPELALTLDGFDPLARQLSVARILVDRPRIDLVREANGGFNLARLAPPPGPADPAPAATPAPGHRLLLGELAIRGARLDYRDEQGTRPLRASVDAFDLDIRQVATDLQQRQVDIGEIASGGAALALLHLKPAPRRDAPMPAPARVVPTDAPAEASASPGYRINLARLALDGWSARIEDRGLARPALTTIAPIRLAADGLSTTPGAAPGRLDLRAVFNGKGRLAVAGALGLAPLHADLGLDLQGVDLLPVQPYVTERVNLLVTRAMLSAKGAVRLDTDGKGVLRGGYRGSLGIADLATIDKVSGNDFLRWRQLAASGIDARIEPVSLAIDRVALSDFFARVIIDANGRINLQDIAASGDGTQKSLTDDAVSAAPQSAPPAPAPAPAGKPPIAIRQLRLAGGQVRFTDNFIKPNYSATLDGLGGTVDGLSSSAGAATVDLRGSVNSAPLLIAGSVDPLGDVLALDLKASVKGMELAPLSPYSGKYAGYGIEKGKLSFDVAYRLENRTLAASNRVVLDQLTFGDKVDSPDATTLPVRLAVALLRDSNGVIDIELPIGGSLDDPQFSVGGIIVKVLVNLLTKAVTAPFALLGSLFGGGEELSYLEFEAGRAQPPAAGDGKLESLAKALAGRPALQLEIAGRYDPETDRAGLRRVSIERKVKALKLKQLVARGEAAELGTLTIAAEEYPALLAKVYKAEKFDKPRNAIGLAKDLPVAEMEKLMVDNAVVKDDELVALANQRAQAVKDRLIAAGIDAARIYLLAAKPGAADADVGVGAAPSRTDFSLR